MDFDETYQVGLRPEKTKPCTLTANHAMGFGEREKMGRRGVVFCEVNDTPLLPLSLDRFPSNFPRTRVQVVASNIWFHIPEKFPLRDRICQKPLLGYPICDQATQARSQGGPGGSRDPQAIQGIVNTVLVILWV